MEPGTYNCDRHRERNRAHRERDFPTKQCYGSYRELDGNAENLLEYSEENPLGTK